MTLSSVPRATQHGNILIASHKSPLRLRTTISRNQNARSLQLRTLWWWSRHRHGNDWPSTFDEGLEERVRRHQKIMRYRYSKALRRSALWDREDSPRSLWPWNRGRCGDKHHLSNSNVTQAKLEESENQRSSASRSFETFHRDFESFKAAVDRAVERDPAGTLFGRRLQGPTSANNSSWTSFSWFWDPKEIRDPKQSDQEAVPQAPAPNQSPEGQDLKTSHIKTSAPQDPERYVYDPISGRKVLKPSPSPQPPESESKKPFFQTLFGEHGVDIPVKPYKPHKVYGYGVEDSEKRKVAQPEPDTSKTVGKGFENSRKREFQMLMASTLGNSIDTAAEFGGKYDPEPKKTDDTTTVKKARTMPEPDEDAPLFSGTAYEAVSERLFSSKGSPSNWLQREGFASANNQASAPQPEKDDQAVEIPIKKFQSRMEPALDRMKSSTVSSNESTKLEPALDRVSHMKVRQYPSAEEQSTTRRSVSPDVADADKDIDLLRPWDVRAATKSARVTKQDVDKSKRESREKLETDFAERQKDDGSLEEPSPTAKLTEKLGAVWKHISEHPTGIVARTMQSMNLFNENFSKQFGDDHIKHDGYPTSQREYPTQDQKIRRPSKSGPRQSTLFTPSQEVLDAQMQSQERTSALQQANKERQTAEKSQDDNAKKLAGVIVAEYETEYGKIDVNHRQQTVDSSQSLGLTSASSDSSKSKRPHALTTATVKPGVVRDMVIEDHVGRFEPELAKLTDEAKEIRRELHEAHQHVKAIKSNRPETYWNSSAAPPASLDEPIASMKKAEVVPAMILGATGSATESISKEVSATKKFESEPKIPFSSAYVVLAYNTATANVEPIPMSIPLVDASEPVNSLKLLSGLSHPGEFFKHFAELEKGGYELVAGNVEMLMFKKNQTITSRKEQTTQFMTMPQSPQTGNVTSEQRNKIAAEETAAQPEAQVISPKHTENKKEAATVMDDIPADIDPTPGPAAPTAPPSMPASRLIPNNNRVRRQEHVFSATIKPTSAAAAKEATSGPSASIRTDQPVTETTAGPKAKTREGFFTRFARGVRRVVLTVIALGGGAYTVGVIAEGIGAQAQQRNSIEDANAQGPRKRVVMTGQRPGIFSTESSR